MHGREGEERRGRRSCNWHMRTVPTRVGVAVAPDADGSSSSSASSSPNFFHKDGRKISVGDCALFKPPQDSPPFIGIIRSLTLSKENDLKLGVNWLYRPAEVKLSRGILLEAAPNEIFYSFHRDETLAAALLHPCKVAFLPKGVELPSGICSFVCRRVYDISNSCLWWLTDQDYINEHQEEVDQLLYKTRIEMHATVQPNGRSPKRMNGPTSASQLKSGSDCVQNSASSFASQSKGKKRERGDQGSEPIKREQGSESIKREQGSEPIKRERSIKMEDGDSGHSRAESFLRCEIAKITDKGGLVDLEGVEKLVQLMLPDRSEKKVDLAGRLMLTGVIAGTDKVDCLGQFVRLKGLSALDEWLQEVHKGKVGDGNSLKDNDKSVEEFILVLLRALDKLPVNLNALQMCNIGKSVNNLRSHKNSEIQKKARSLVDTWKKRVEAEMNINDAKSGSNQAVSWSAKSKIPEVGHGGIRNVGGSSEAATKSSVGLPASKSPSVKLIQGETASKSAVSPGSLKSPPSHASIGGNLKDGQGRSAVVSSVSDLPMTISRDEKSSSSSQSHNNSQSCSSDHAKTGGAPGKEDARSSTAGSGRVSSGPSRHKKLVNCLPGSSASGREMGSSRTSLHRNVAPEKVSQSGLTSERAVDVPFEVNSHKLIVKIPNRGRSPAQNASGGSFDDPSVMISRASSPMRPERPDQLDPGLKEKTNVCQANISSDGNAESWQNNELKDMVTACDEVDGSPGTAPQDDYLKTGENTKKALETSKSAMSSSGSEFKLARLPEASPSSMNALVESCAKVFEPSASESVEDDVGMNLLASVAAGEMLMSEMVSPRDSPQRNPSAVGQSCVGNDSKMNSSPRNHCQPSDVANNCVQKDMVNDDALLTRKAESKASPLPSEDVLSEEQKRNRNSSSTEMLQAAGPCPESDKNVNEFSLVTSAARFPAAKLYKTVDSGHDDESNEKTAIDRVNQDAVPDSKTKAIVSLSSGNKVPDAVSGVEVASVAAKVGSFSSQKDGRHTNEDSKDGMQVDERPTDSVVSEDMKPKELATKNVDDVKAERTGGTDVGNRDAHMELQSIGQEVSVATSGAGFSNHKGGAMEENKETRADCEQNLSPSKGLSDLPGQVKDISAKSRLGKLTGGGADEIKEFASPEVSSLAGVEGADKDAKVGFDLNEGLNTDDVKYSEPANLTAHASAAVVPLVNRLPFPTSSVSTSLSAPIPVAAASKGPFVPPGDLLRTKVELGWKGSAATSAFRPAEPRKLLEMPLLATNPPPNPDTASVKPSRPPLDIDLNVPDEGIVEDAVSRNCILESTSFPSFKSNCEIGRDEMNSSAPTRGSGGLGLDLNQIDEAPDLWSYSTSSSRRLDVNFSLAKSSAGTLPNGTDTSAHRDFDLNDGPAADDLSAEPSIPNQHARSSVPPQQPVSGLKMNNLGVGNFSSWFPSGSTYSAVTIPSMLSNRGEQSLPVVATGGQPRMVGPSAGAIPFNTEIYRAPVLSSSPAVAFPSTAYQYSVFPPYAASFPLQSATFSSSSTTYVDPLSGGRLCFPPVHPVGPPSAVSTHYPRPVIVSLPDGGGSYENNKKWNRQALDLNSGPGGPDLDGRDETSSLAPRQLSVVSSQALAEDQARMYQVSSGVLKRKEPEGGWDNYKQSTWQ